MNERSIKKFLTSRAAVAALIAIAALLIFYQYRQIRGRSSIGSEIRNLQKQQAELERNNHDLNSSLEYLTTSGSQDRIARQQLGLKKNGEIVYNFSEVPQTIEAQNTPNSTEPGTSNLKSWWMYLFNNH